MYPEKYLPQVLVLAILDKYLTNKSYTIDIEIIYIYIYLNPPSCIISAP